MKEISALALAIVMAASAPAVAQSSAPGAPPMGSRHFMSGGALCPANMVPTSNGLGCELPRLRPRTGPGDPGGGAQIPDDFYSPEALVCVNQAGKAVFCQSRNRR